MVFESSIIEEAVILVTLLVLKSAGEWVCFGIIAFMLPCFCFHVILFSCVLHPHCVNWYKLYMILISEL